MEFMPSAFLNTTANGASVASVSSYSRTGILPDAGMTANEIKGLVDYHTYTGNKYKKYVSVRKFIRRQMRPRWYSA